MKALSLYQPWASAIVLGAKMIETRSWPTTGRGRLAIHAGKDQTHAKLVAESWPGGWHGALGPILGDAPSVGLAKCLPYGAIVGVVDLLGCRPVEEYGPERLDRRFHRPDDDPHGRLSWTERMFGDYSAGRYGWDLAAPVWFRDPIEVRGHQRVFNLDDVVSAEIDALVNAIRQGQTAYGWSAATLPTFQRFRGNHDDPSSAPAGAEAAR
jgi:activating signal cointegrator 1